MRRGNSAPAQGDFLARLRREPESVEAQLERNVYADFGSEAERDAAFHLLRADSAVELAYVVVIIPVGGFDAPDRPARMGSTKSTGIQEQAHLGDLNLSLAWQRAGGWGLIGVLDNGIHPDHPELRSLTGTSSLGGSFVPGGNYLPYFSRNVGGRGQPVNNLSELQQNTYVQAYEEQCDDDDGLDDNLLSFQFAGHGTHVAGLVAANGGDQSGVSGALPGLRVIDRKKKFPGMRSEPTASFSESFDRCRWRGHRASVQIGCSSPQHEL